MQVSHRGASGQLRHTAQRLGNQAQALSGLRKANHDFSLLNNVDHMKSIYCRHSLTTSPLQSIQCVSSVLYFQSF
jgi:hypothetical protein